MAECQPASGRAGRPRVPAELNVDMMGDWWTPAMMPDPSLGELRAWEDCVWDLCERWA